MTQVGSKIFGEVTISTNLTTNTTGASWTPSANSTKIVSCVVQGGTNGLTVNPTLTGNGLTWSVAVKTSRTTSSPQKFLVVFITTSVGAGSTGALTYTAGGTDNFDSITWSVTEVTNPPPSGTIFPSGNLGASDPGPNGITVAISMTTGHSLFAAFAMWDSFSSATPKAGWTELDEQASVGAGSLETQFLYGTDTSGVSLWNNATSQAGIVLEINEAPAFPIIDTSYYIPSVRMPR